MFCVAEPEAVTICTFASSRCPTIPIASRMLSCESRKNSCGKTCSTSRSSGSWMPRAASMARRTSSRCTSRGRDPIVIPPRLFTPRTWTPATPISADSTGTLTIDSASSTARRIELTARSRFTIWPLRQPFDSAAPSAANLTPPSSSISPINAQVFVLPMSSATMCRSFFVKSASPKLPKKTPPLPPNPSTPSHCRRSPTGVTSSVSASSPDARASPEPRAPSSASPARYSARAESFPAPPPLHPQTANPPTSTAPSPCSTCRYPKSKPCTGL